MGISYSSILWHLGSAYTSARTGTIKHIFPKSFYNPLPDHGLHAAVATPHQNKQTYFPVPPKYIERFNGFKGKHYTSSDEFKTLWQQRRRGSYYNIDLKTGLSDYCYEKRHEERGRFYANGTVSSREQNDRYLKPKFYEVSRGISVV